MSTLEVNTIDSVSGTSNLTIGSSNSSQITLKSGATLTNFPDNTPYFKADLTTGQAVSATTWTTLNINNVIYDTASAFSTSTYAFFAPAGKYFFTGSAGNNSAINYLYVSIYKNGNAALQVQADTSNAGILNCNGILDSNGSDYFQLKVFTASSTTITADAHRTYFSGFKLVGS